VIAANWWGKLKTLSQIVAVSLLLASYQLGQWVFLSKAALWVALALTVASLISYFSSFWRLVVGDGR
jgi:CDP-diacylglycerol--glycerol-3-phosphate 3-phosphatidyltransferase